MKSAWLPRRYHIGDCYGEILENLFIYWAAVGKRDLMPVQVALLLTAICLIHPPWLGEGNGYVAGFARHAWIWEELTTMKQLQINVVGLLCEITAIWLTYAALKKQ